MHETIEKALERLTDSINDELQSEGLKSVHYRAVQFNAEAKAILCDISGESLSLDQWEKVLSIVRKHSDAFHKRLEDSQRTDL
jgi:hypothetical protein